ncbi:hypothetical protein L6452_43758 [Arctium lappa]|uniref:Uncharacterized protein n=1 Tax=Arctium lappa TaxID=4217 RepID=A0ACB8XEH4_ARCLA|nr:hypothetical protein L6452_43758 [Arctium lappa]
MRQRRWLELLKDYDCELLNHPGKANVVAYALSRKSYGNEIKVTLSKIDVITSLVEDIKASQVKALREENLKAKIMRFEVALLVAGNEARCSQLCGKVHHLSASQSGTSKALWKFITIGHSGMEVGAHHYGLRHQATKELEGT